MTGKATGRPSYEWSGLHAAVVEFADAPPQCTIYPADVTRDQQVTTWLTAVGDAFVDPADYR